MLRHVLQSVIYLLSKSISWTLYFSGKFRTAVRLREVEQQLVQRERAVEVRLLQVQEDFDRFY